MRLSLTNDARSRLERLPELLLPWFSRSARRMPWRETPKPYYTWISEIMLQQTRVEAATDYFLRFVSALPDIEALAKVPDDELMKLWEGLGYYSRARNLKRAAQIVCEEYDGELPADRDALLRLPGIGSYTAGAIASIAFGLPFPAVDGNVLRVVSRVTESDAPVSDQAVRKDWEGEIRAILPRENVGDFNQSLMEVGALVCLPNGAPRCGVCPLAGICGGFRNETAERFPVKAEKKERRVEHLTVFLLLCEGKAALSKRGEKGLLAGLWELPNTTGMLTPEEAEAFLCGRGLSVHSVEPAGEAKHIFSHVEWRMTGYLARVEKAENVPDLRWADAEALENSYPLPSAFKKYRGLLKSVL